ncbi:MAG: hypothetical protein LQ342_007414 [Letrouitia transgressa]|nr:MAG: hypothetical protein LQ342_007414 [Letrouitia transgressa]
MDDHPNLSFALTLTLLISFTPASFSPYSPSYPLADIIDCSINQISHSLAAAGHADWALQLSCVIASDPELGDIAYELKAQSPPYVWGDADALMAVGSVLGMLEDGGASVDGSCELKVTVSATKKKEGLGFQTLKNLVIVLGVFEEWLEALHPHLGNPGWRFLEDGVGADPLRIVEAVEACEDTGELLVLLGCGGEEEGEGEESSVGAYDITAQAIGFPAHPGTLSPKVIGTWVAFCTGLVVAAEEMGTFGLFELLEKWEVERGKDRRGRVIGLLRALGMEAVAGYYDSRGLFEARGQEREEGQATVGAADGEVRKSKEVTGVEKAGFATETQW